MERTSPIEGATTNSTDDINKIISTSKLRCSVFVNWLCHFPSSKIGWRIRSSWKTKTTFHMIHMLGERANTVIGNTACIICLSVDASHKEQHLNGNVAHAGRDKIKMKWEKWNKKWYNNDFNWVNYLWCSTLSLYATTVVRASFVFVVNFRLWMEMLFARSPLLWLTINFMWINNNRRQIIIIGFSFRNFAFISFWLKCFLAWRSLWFWLEYIYGLLTAEVCGEWVRGFFEQNNLRKI